MKRSLPPLKTLEAFELAATRLSLSKAADEMFLTHGAISRQIKTLEEYLGVMLFHRHNRRIALTEAGVDFLATVRMVLDLTEAGASRVARAARQGPIVVACLPTFTMRWLIPRLYDFNLRHPGIEIRLAASPGPAAFDRDDIDVAIGLNDASWPAGITATPFLDEDVGPVCSPALLERYPINGPADLAITPILQTDTRPEAWRQWAQAAGLTEPGTQQATRFEHFYFMLEAAVAGLGVAVAPHALVSGDIATGRLVAPLGFVPSGQSYHLLNRSSATEAPPITALRSWLIEMGGDQRLNRAAIGGSEG